jgi:DtxR family transcriptional regulator, Mn-dependent transcriptional regulator
MSPPSFKFRDRGRILVEDALKHLLDCAEAGRGATAASLAGALGLRLDKAAGLVAALRARGLAAAAGDSHHLTEDGRLYALQVVRSHRLYETWLARESGLPAGDWHRAAHHAEHHLDAAAADLLADRLNNPRFDPHGDPIPTREGHLPARARVALGAWPDGAAALVDHVEDEPESLFREIGRLGLAPGLLLENPRHRPDGAIVATAEGRQLVIAAALAANIHVVAAEPGAAGLPGLRRLADLADDEQGVVHGLAAACTGGERARLLDLGVVPGSAIRRVLSSPFGWPRAFWLRGTLVALRREQAGNVLLRPPAP